MRMVGMRSRASEVARPEAVVAPFILNSRRFVRFVHVLWTCLPDARERIPTTHTSRCLSLQRLQDKIGPQKVGMPSRDNLLDNVTAFRIRLSRDQ